jgi:antitoxin component of MazEF toxin-antitoxin module
VEVRARRTGGSITITVPAEVVHRHGIAEGDALDVDITAEGFSVRPRRSPLAKVIEEWRRNPLVPAGERRPTREETLGMLDAGRDEHGDRSYLEPDE